MKKDSIVLKRFNKGFYGSDGSAPRKLLVNSFF